MLSPLSAFCTLWATCSLGSTAHATLALPPVRPDCVLIAATNDVHANIGQAAEPGAGPASGMLGLGAALLPLRARQPVDLLLVDAGDMLHGSLVAHASAGQVAIAGYNALGYDVACLGNHEFDGGQPMLQRRLAEAHFPFLALNLVSGPSQRPPPWPNLRPSLWLQRNGVRIGVLGVITPTTPATTPPATTEGLRFLPPAAPLAAAAAQLRRHGAQLVLLLAHMGGDCPSPIAQQLASCRPDAGGELVQLLAALPPGSVDVAVGGHTHHFLAHWLHGVATVEAGAQGHHVSLVYACARPQGGIDRAHSRILPPQPLAELAAGRRPPPALATALAPYAAQVATLRALPQPIWLPTALGPDALCAATAEGARQLAGTAIGLHNCGGLRAALAAGPLAFGELFDVSPFDNHLVVLRLSGAQLGQLWRQMSATRSYGGGAHSTLAMAGLRALPGRGPGDGVELIQTDGQPLLPHQQVEVACNTFIVDGGDGAPPNLGAHQLRQLPQHVRDALSWYLSRHHPAPPRLAPLAGDD